MEAKIGKASLDEDQIKRYLAIAKANQLDAVITLSNQFAALPTHHPVKVPKIATKKVGLFHWSWMFMRTQAVVQLRVEQDLDPEQRFILEEMVRYFEHPTSGVLAFHRMNREWRDVCSSV